MPENNDNKLFWSSFKTIKKVSKEHGLKLSHREYHRITNEYVTQIDECDDLHYDPKTYSDPTGEQAVRDWFSQWVAADVKAVA